jgi:deferrochelatase/peroxidase EfeB
MHPTLQEGIYFQHGQTPAGFFTIVMLEVPDEATARQAAGALAGLWQLYQQLKQGMVRDLPGVEVPTGDLQVMLGFGRKAFELRGRRGAVHAPAAVTDDDFLAPAVGGPISTDSGILFESDTNPAAVRLRSSSPASRPCLGRGVVETATLRDDSRARHGPRLRITAVYSGAKRDDGRSWIDFQDGISNIAPQDRERVIMVQATDRVAANDDNWTDGGTYLAFIRLYIDLGVWRSLKPQMQSQLVGRDK